MKIVIIDNYDSFTYNVFHYISEISKTIPEVFYNDDLSWEEFLKLGADGVVISPGPGHPDNKKDFGISKTIIQQCKIPTLGICLGHQGIGSAFGALVERAPEIMHGRRSRIYHNGEGVFKNIPQGFLAVRYHSFAVTNLPSELKKTAWSEDGVIMGLQHTTLPLWGVQFHPESIGTDFGKDIFRNFISECVCHPLHS